jgi:hypothetical protein
MSRIINLTDKLDNNDYYFYCLDSHGELTFILERDNILLYANIYNVMVTHDKPLDKEDKRNIDKVKALIGELNNE